MTTTHVLTRPQGKTNRMVWAGVGLALFAALAYVLIALHVLGIGDFSQEEGPAGIVLVAAGCYLAGGLLILLRRRWLWGIGAFINAMVIIFFINLYQNRPAVMFSPEVTYVFDLGVIIPLSVMTGFLILRKAPLGYLLSAVLLTVLVIVGVLVSVQTIFQMSAGFTLTVPEFAAKAGSFMLLSLFAIYLLVRLLRGVSEQAPGRVPARRAARA